MTLAISLLGMMVVILQALDGLQTTMLDDRVTSIHHLSEVGRLLVEREYQRFRRGEIDEATARSNAVETLRILRYGSKGYYFINDWAGVSILNPIHPDHEGGDYSGASHVQRMNRRAIDGPSGGPVYYDYPQPGETRPQAKVAYVLPFRPWSWTIASGIYLDDMEQEIGLARRRLMLALLCFVIISALTTLLVATEVSKENKAAARQLERSERRFRAAQEASLDAFAIYEPLRRDGRTADFRVLYANRNAAAHYHCPPEAMEGQTLGHIAAADPETVPDLEKLVKWLRLPADQGMPADFVLRQEGDRGRAMHHMAVAFDGLVAVTFRDVTTAIEARQSLEKAKRDAEYANESKSRFLAAASHDLRQPLQALTLYLEILARTVPEENRAIMKNIGVCLDSLGEMLSGILDLSKLDSGIIKPAPALFPVAQLLEKVVASHAQVAHLKGLELRMVSTRLRTRTDPVLFERIVTNLVSNAVRYTAQGGIVIGCRRQDGRIWLQVADTGIGIPEDKTEAIFEEFLQLGNPERSREKGSGLGLAVVRRTSQLLGLEMRVSSRPGRGSVFAIELPPAGAAPPAPSAAERNGPGESGTQDETSPALLPASG